MNLLCPDCHSSVSVDESEPWLRCDVCGLEANLSRVETAPGSASFPMVKDLTGESLGGYDLEELIGVGGMGVVYKARRADEVDGVPVAVKVLNCDYHWQREEFVSRFQREAKALARLDHPNIVTILDSGQADDQYYLVTEYVDGVNLAQHMRTREVSLREVVELMAQVCGAITYAHEHGIVHRDIKPANVVIAGERAMVLDFGLAQITGGSTGLSSLTRTDLAMGTINYLSPEQRTNAKRVDARSDVFSLGVVLYEMLTGQVPLGGFEPASHFRPEVGRKGDRLVARALESSPQRRYQSVAELAGDLRQLVQPRKTGRMAALAVVALAAVGLGVGLWKVATPADRGRASGPVVIAEPQGGGDAEATRPAPRPATMEGDSADGEPAGEDAVDKAAPTRGLPTFVVDSSGRRFPWLGGKGVYRIGKGARPVAIIDHKGQRWPWPKGASLREVLSTWYPGGKVKGVRGGMRVKGVKGGMRVKGVKGGKAVVRRPVEKAWRPPKGVKGAVMKRWRPPKGVKGAVKKRWRPRKGVKGGVGKGVRPRKGKRLVARKKLVKRRPAPRIAPPARRPAPRYDPRK